MHEVSASFKREAEKLQELLPSVKVSTGEVQWEGRYITEFNGSMLFADRVNIGEPDAEAMYILLTGKGLQ